MKSPERAVDEPESERLPTSGKSIDWRLPNGAVICATGLVLPNELTLDQWKAVGIKLCKISGAVQFAIGDWWIGRHSYDESEVSAVIDQLAYKRESLMNFGWVAGKVRPSLRNEAVSYIPYIGISPYLNAASDSVLRWLVHVFTRITDQEGKPLCKTHCFGATSDRIVRRYPWFSLDSTTWALSAAYGNILMPRFQRTGPDYTYPQQFRMSERDSGRSNNSMLNIAPWDRKIVDEYFATLGLTFSEVRRDHAARLRVNASYYLGLEAQLTAAPFNPSRRLAGLKPRLYSQRAADFDYAPKIFLATMIKTHQQAVVLTQLGAKHRLISYYDCGRCDAEQIDGYTSKGICPISMTGWRAWVAGLKRPQTPKDRA